MIGIIGVLVAAVLAGGAIYYFNAIVRQKNLMAEALSGVDVQLKRRHDLIPNLVAIVQGYLTHERGTLENVTGLRAQLTKTGLQDIQKENDLSRGLKTIFAVAENYPELKANQGFQDLHQSLVRIEDELQMARRYYNGTIRDYNTLVQMFPGVLVATVIKATPATFFEIEYATERQNPEVRLS